MATPKWSQKWYTTQTSSRSAYNVNLHIPYLCSSPFVQHHLSSSSRKPRGMQRRNHTLSEFQYLQRANCSQTSKEPGLRLCLRMCEVTKICFLWTRMGLNGWIIPAELKSLRLHSMFIHICKRCQTSYANIFMPRKSSYMIMFDAARTRSIERRASATSHVESIAVSPFLLAAIILWS
jgi:hypothetical protein